MDIKIGFTDSPRELVMTLDSDQESVVNQVTDALDNGEETLQLQDTKGRRYIVRSSRVSYVEVGTTTQRSVGFAGA